MLTNPACKYAPFPPVRLTHRQWPNRTITAPPIWMSTDLRDGNQALFEPMDGVRKLQLFRALCDIGFKEIEVAFPSASETDFDFVRLLIEGNHIPSDVTIAVLTHARAPLIRRTLEALKDARRAIVHIVNATSKPFRDMVLGMDQAAVLAMATSSVELVKQLSTEQPDTDWTIEYSLETFTATELDFALEVANAVTAASVATPTQRLILNLPASVEVTTPNVYADQIEWMHCRLAKRDCIVLSIHPHNDRGTAVAAAELALMAGAERVEGCLFGNGERTGNVDLVTLALNLYTQGVSPGLDFSNINAVLRIVEECTQLPISARHPYVGDLVFTAFSGSHQDAIKKGLAAQQPDFLWNVPYLPIDPADLGRSYESVIRVNSQSGKGGISYLLENTYGVCLPRRLLVEFSCLVQRHVDHQGGEIVAADLWRLFTEAYLETTHPLRYIKHQIFECDAQGIHLTVEWAGATHLLCGEGNGPIDAAVHALQNLGVHIQVQSYEERSIGKNAVGSDARACAFLEVATENGKAYGAGIDVNIVTASLKALVSATNRLAAHTLTAMPT